MAKRNDETGVLMDGDVKVYQRGNSKRLRQTLKYRVLLENYFFALDIPYSKDRQQ